MEKIIINTAGAWKKKWKKAKKRCALKVMA